ncbi:RHO1 GDP-GTP exchange protein 2 [Coemansia guatemalensis]|uniref:RHO1 GDP-GTP exchange protein 2 n=1 Tax=Coemansia guatemalensis TaxID=2761395 RepID=A0A9W8I174_9FUNG|nr:RHO1 GDP-GTP exchange protein 2 [Coemansia guatemalensis]
MATAPTTQNGSANGSTRKHRASPFTSWLKKGSGGDGPDTNKLASPAEEIKLVFLRQLKLSSFELDGRHYHSVFTGAQIVDIIMEHFKLPDRKLASNVASRLIDCSLYTHVSSASPSESKARQGAVVDSNAEIYTLTAEADAILKTLHRGDTLNRSKTHTRKRYKDFLNPRSTDSQSARGSPSTQGSRAARSEASSSSNEGAALALHQSASPPLPAPLDMRRARETRVAQQGRDRRSVADSVASEGAGAAGGHIRRTPDSPSDTLVSHGPGHAAAREQGCAPSSPSTAGDRRSGTLPESSSAAAGQLEGVDIPTGALEGLLNTWSFAIDLPPPPPAKAASSASSERQPSPFLARSDVDPASREASAAAEEIGRPSSASAELLRTVGMGHERISVGADEITAGSDEDAAEAADGNDDDDSSSHGLSRLASLEWLGHSPETTHQRVTPALWEGSISDRTVSRTSSMPSIFELFSAHEHQAGARVRRARHRSSLPTWSEEDWLADLLAGPACASRHSLAGSGTQAGVRAHVLDRTMRSFASHATSEYAPYEPTVQRGGRATWRRHSTGTHVGLFGSADFASDLASDFGAVDFGAGAHLLTPTTQRSSIAGTTAGTVNMCDGAASRSSLCLASLSDAAGSSEAAAGDSGQGSAAGMRLGGMSLALSSIPHFPRPRAARRAVAGSDSGGVRISTGAGTEGSVQTEQEEAQPVADEEVLHGTARSWRQSKRTSARGTVLRRRAADGDGGERASSATLGGASDGASDGGSRRVSCNMQLQLWRDTVPAAVVQGLDAAEVARQEAIHEIIATEHGYLRDLQLIDPVFVQPLLGRHSAVPATRAAGLVRQLFFNYAALVANSTRLCTQLRARQAAAAVVAGVGDIFDAWADALHEFVEYAVHVPIAQCELEAELLRNEGLARFLQEAEATPAARRLPIQSFLARPATRLARYPLLLDAITKRTAPGTEAELLRSAAAKVRAALTEIDQRTGDAAEGVRIRQIAQRLRLVRGARESLALDSSTRRLVREGVLHTSDGAPVLAFLFDNALILATEERVGYAKGVSRYAADDRIIPVSMLDVHVAAEPSGIRGALARAPPTSRALTFVHVGCRALCRTLIAATAAERAQWAAAVARRVCVPQTLVEAYTDARMLSDRDFTHGRGPLCSAPFVSLLSGCHMALFGNRDGLHMGIYGVPTSVVRVSPAPNVSKIHILRRHNLVVALSDANLLVFALSEVEKATAQVGAGVAGTRIASGVAFFDVGSYMGAPLLVLMKPRGSRSHFKCMQPQLVDDCSTDDGENGTAASSRPTGDSTDNPTEHPAEHPTDHSAVYSADDPRLRTLRVVYRGSDACLRLVSEFVVLGRAKRVHFLRRKLCVVGPRAFDIVDLQHGRVLRSLPDPLDDDFSFVHAHACGQALAICKVGREFLLCYEAFAFFIDNFGRRSRPDVFIRWEMRPLMITFRPPYIVAVNSRFLEIRHIESGVLLSIVRIPHALCLNPDSRSTVMHIAVGPEPVGIPADIVLDPSTAPSGVSEPDTASGAMPVPAAVPATAMRPSSIASIALLKSTSANSAGSSTASQNHIVPGLAGTSGKRLFPEAIPGHYRIIEMRLPPLKTSSSSKRGSTTNNG